MDNPIKDYHSSRLEQIIAFIPAIIVILWLFIFTLMIAAKRNYDFGFVFIGIPVSFATITILLARTFYPVKYGCLSILKTIIPSILVYPAACLFFIIRSQTGPNGAGVMIYYSAIASFWLILGVTMATILGSNLRRWFGKPKP